MASFHHRIKSGKKGTAKEHAAYIERRGRHRTREDLVHASHGNLPDWTEGDPIKFWREADKHERANGAAYREHEIALPNELTQEQLIDLAERIVQQVVGVKPYQYAIHMPEGKLGGILNPHMHLMHTDRIPDDIERTPDRMFTRYNPQHPERGGWRKDSGGKSPIALRDHVIATRKAIATLQNAALAEHGHTARVDHRSLREQGQRRVPERHLGQGKVRGMTVQEREVYVAGRSKNTAT